MKPRIGYFFWILMLAFGLMILVAATQVLTSQNVNGLKKGNREAVITFTINNRLQELVNLCFDLNTKFTNSALPVKQRQSLVDSLTMMDYNASVLEQINLNSEATARFKKLNHFTNKQVELSVKAMQLADSGNNTAALQAIDSLRKIKVADSVYAIALSIQKYLEKDLQSTLSNNTIASSRLSDYNKMLAIIAIAAVLILGTIIINRHLRQVQLIKELEKATAEAKKSASIKEQFLANMSHEIRTPLNAIKGFTRLLSQTPLSREQQQYSTIIDDASGNLVHIVNDILDISKIEAGKFRIETKEFNLEKVLQTVQYMSLNAAAEKKLEYFQQVNDNVPLYLKGDPERLGQVLINLVNNAIKFTEAGYVNTIISLQKEEDRTIWIEFIIEDSGIGIPAGKQELIFQRFEQLDTGNENITQGTGLGLSIVKNLTNLMGGTIMVDSEYGKGSVFKVLLPFERAAHSVPKEETENVSMASLHHYTDATALIVEDNKVNQLLLKHTLSGLGISADMAANGKEALNILDKKEFDLILMDIQMPVMDGYAAIQAIRTIAKINTPVVAMTAYAMPGEKEKCIAAGMNDYLAKPVDFLQLTSMLEKYIQHKRKDLINHATSQAQQENFLLQLAGGDKNMVLIILKEIKEEIPRAADKLKAARNKNELNSIFHHMISTFSPLGNETEVMRRIQQLRMTHDHSMGINNNSIVELAEELSNLEREIKKTMDSMN